MNQEDNYTCEDCIYFIHGVNEEDVDGVAILNCSKQGMVRSWCPDFNSGYNWKPKFLEKWEEDYVEESENNTDPPDKMIHTHGQISPCPFCGSHEVKTYSDGIAQCIKCKEWWEY